MKRATVPHAVALPAAGQPLSHLLRRALRLVADWNERVRTRNALARLDPHILRDIGLSAPEARAEVARPFWQG